MAEAIGAAASTPLGLIALLAVTGAATFLFWSQAKIKAESADLVALPEEDRIRAVERRHGTIPKSVSAEAWLKSRRQLYLFLAYICTLAALVLGLTVLYGAVSPRVARWHRAELRTDYGILRSKLAAHELAARNLVNAFSGASSRAAEPDHETDTELTNVISAYNTIYDDLRQNRYTYESGVKRWLSEAPTLGHEVTSLLDYALNDVHLNGVKKFNMRVREKAEEIRQLRRENNPEANARVESLKSSAAREILDLSQELDGKLRVYTEKTNTLTQQIGDS